MIHSRYAVWENRARELAVTLSPVRQVHVQGVVETCERLCRRFGELADRGRVAAWIHDLAREWPAQRLLRQAEAFGIMTDEVEREMPVLLHGQVIAAWVRQEWGVDDIEILQAVGNHTTGRPGMGRLETILYVADAIEPGRSYDGVERLRRLAGEDLEQAALAVSDSTMHYLLNAGMLLHPRTLLTRNDLWRRVRRRSLTRGWQGAWKETGNDRPGGEVGPEGCRGS
jgi:predicted HD superfamily hydrolase involved in NAD metabolism